MNLKRVFRSLLFSAFLLSGVVQAQSVREAVALTENELFTRADGMFRQLLAGSPKDGEIWFYYGENFFYSERLDSAELCFRNGVQFNPRQPLSHAGLGKILSSKGIKAEAQAQFQEAIALSTDKTNKYDKKVQALVLREVAEGYAYGRHRDLAAAMTHLEQSLVLEPNDPEAHILKGDILFEMNPSDASAPLVSYKRGIDLAPMSARPVAKKALMYHKGANYEAAIAEYTRAIERDASYAPSYSGRAESFFMSRKYDLATADYNTYLDMNKGNRSARIRYAKFLFLSKKYDEALAEINALRASGETDATLKRLLGYAYTEKGQFEEAKAAMDDYFIEQAPERVISTDYEYMAKIYAGLAAAAQPGTQPANYDSLACEMCVKGAQMDRSKDYLYVEAMKLFVKTKQYGRAIEAIKSKMASGKVETNDYYYLGDAALKGKMWATADSAWAIYIERNPKAYQGYKYRARAQVGMDPDKTIWGAKPYFEEMLRKMKPEEMAKSPADVEEAYFYLGYYHYTVSKDLPTSKCMFEKVKTANAGTPNTKIALEMLATKDLKDVAPGTCEMIP